MKIVYRRYASLYFIVGADTEEDVGRFVHVSRYTLNICCSAQNELGLLEFIHCLVETLDKYFQNVVRSCSLHKHKPANQRCLQCELDIMFNLDKAHFILSE